MAAVASSAAASTSAVHKNASTRIEELFIQCTAMSSGGAVEFSSVAKLFWPALDNRVSLVDLAGLYSMAIPPHSQQESIDAQLFADIFSAVAKLKYPTGKEYCDKLLEDIRVAKPLTSIGENSFFSKSMEKSVIRSLLKFDIPIRRAYSSFAGKAISAGGAITWEEVKRLNLSMEASSQYFPMKGFKSNYAVNIQVDGFLSFTGAFSIIPAMLELKVSFRVDHFT
jgi:hypothetical protein